MPKPKQGFQETYYIVRYRGISEIIEKSFRSLKKQVSSMIKDVEKAIERG